MIMKAARYCIALHNMMDEAWPFLSPISTTMQLCKSHRSLDYFLLIGLQVPKGVPVRLGGGIPVHGD